MPLDSYFDPEGSGGAVGIARDGEDAFLDVIGFGDIDARSPITSRTSFDLASVTKVFTGTAAMLLGERGQLRISDPIAQYLPGIKQPSGHRPVLIQDLLWHISDIPDYLAAAAQDESFEFLPESVRKWACGRVPSAEPGQRDEYSNTNYFLLAEIISEVAGMSYADFLRTNLFEPFGLSDTFVLGHHREHTVRARGYQNVRIGIPGYQRSEFDLPVLGDGGVFSSIRDLLRWQELYYGGHVLKPATLAQALRPGTLDCGTTLGYGCGVMVEDLGDGRRWCGHDGAWSGAAAFLGRWVEDCLSVVVLSNDQHAQVARIAQRSLAAWRRRQSNKPQIA